jgi:hypothetical protein
MRTRWLTLLVILAVALPIVWCFGASLAGHRVFAYRDAAHFYYPLDAWICERWSQGQLPLWNPQDGNGMPVVADTTSAVFYPGKLVFTLPLPFAQRCAWYAVLHLLVAASGAFCLVHYWNVASPSAQDRSCGQLSAGVCALAYACGGTVLFQYCNVVFLVGAAWLPWTLLAAHRMLDQRRVKWSLAMGIGLALMVLGGDPQAAYHAGLLAAGYAFLRRPVAKVAPSVAKVAPSVAKVARPWATSRTGAPNLWRDWLRSRPWATSRTGAPNLWRDWLRSRLILLTIAGALGALLAAVQILPAWSWIRTSERAVYSYPRSIYEVPAYLHRSAATASDAMSSGATSRASGWLGVAQGLWGDPPESEHQGQAYGFSVAPWRLAEMVWPNVSGRTFPRNQRWLSVTIGEDRIWAPSLYLGVVPLVLGLGTWRLRRGDPGVRWFSWILLLAVLGSFGWYGLGLLLKSLISVVGGDASCVALSDPAGGLYWFMTVALPGYAQFRYPAKLLVVANLALAWLAGVGCQRLLTADRTRAARWLRNLALASLLGVVVISAARPWWATWLAAAPADELYGPLDGAGAWRDALVACMHTLCVCGAGWWLVRRRQLSSRRLGAVLLLLTACDLTWANGWMVVTAPAAAMSQPSVIGRASGAASSCTVYRWPSRAWAPAAWRAASSPHRAEESVRWDVATLFAKLHLLGPYRSLRPQTSLAASDWSAFVRARGAALPHPVVLDALGAEYLIVPDDCEPPGSAWLDIPPACPLPGVKLWRNAQAMPRAWIVHEVQTQLPWTSADPRAIQTYYDRLIFPGGRPRDFRHMAVVELESAAPPAATLPAHAAAVEHASVQSDDPTCVEVAATLAAPGLLVLNQFFDPRWTVAIRSDTAGERSGRIVRTNRIMQGVFLPAGTHQLVFRYVPCDLYGAGVVSLLSWLILLVGVVVAVRRRRRRSMSQI